ncbi:unnamed protein product, partial [Adineta steineri]
LLSSKNMSLSNATMAEINALNYANEVFFLFWTFASIALGTVGHLLSIYVFTRPILRSNPCACYFLAATVTGLALASWFIALASVDR